MSLFLIEEVTAITERMVELEGQDVNDPRLDYYRPLRDAYIQEVLNEERQLLENGVEVAMDFPEEYFDNEENESHE